MVGAVTRTFHSCNHCALCTRTQRLAAAAAQASAPSGPGAPGEGSPGASAKGEGPQNVGGVTQASSTGRSAAPSGTLTPEQKAVIAELRQRDAEVRSHEAAHKSAGGGLAGSATFTFQRGPDGQQYAIGGEVPIDVSPGTSPEETLNRARTVRAAALAPANPSDADRSVAVAATRLEANAYREMAEAQFARAGKEDSRSVRDAEAANGGAANGRAAKGEAAGPGGLESAQAVGGMSAPSAGRGPSDSESSDSGSSDRSQERASSRRGDGLAFLSRAAATIKGRQAYGLAPAADGPYEAGRALAAG